MVERETNYEIPVESMSLGDLIQYLESLPPDLVFPLGFHNPHSYRGYYECLAFEPTNNITVAEMLTLTKECLGKTFEGYKGGDFTMREYTDVYLAYEGHGFCTHISGLLLNYMRREAEREASRD